MNALRPSHAFAIATSICAAASIAAACGIDSIGTGEFSVDPDAGTKDVDASVPNDAGGAVDAGDLDAAPAAMDSGAPIDAGVLYRCIANNTLVPDCAQCDQRPLPCILCGKQAGSAPQDFVCVKHDYACLNDYGQPGDYWCSCPNGDAGACPLPNQECYTDMGLNACVTCGEGLTDGYQCKVGGTCDQSTSTCR